MVKRITSNRENDEIPESIFEDTPPATDENHCVVGVQMLSDIELAIKKNCYLASTRNRTENLTASQHPRYETTTRNSVYLV